MLMVEFLKGGLITKNFILAESEIELAKSVSKRCGYVPTVSALIRGYCIFTGIKLFLNT